MSLNTSGIDNRLTATRKQVTQILDTHVIQLRATPELEAEPLAT